MHSVSPCISQQKNTAEVVVVLQKTEVASVLNFTPIRDGAGRKVRGSTVFGVRPLGTMNVLMVVGLLAFKRHLTPENFGVFN